MTETSKRKRLLNFVIDFIVIIIFIDVTVRIESSIDYKTPIKLLRVFIVFGGYHILMEYFFAKTVGKFFTESKVVNLDGSRTDFRTSVIRYLCRWIPFEFVSPALGHDAKAWHDVLSKTLVIDDGK